MIDEGEMSGSTPVSGLPSPVLEDTDTRHPSPGTGRAAASYRVCLDLFEGPLDLLLHLIKKNEVDVANIPVAAITEQYLGYLDLLRDLSLDIAGEYLVMAATLLLIKSRMLLPSPDADEEEEADPRADLVRRLIEYQRYREAAQALAERPRLRRDVFGREPSPEEAADGELRPAVRVTVWELMEALRAVLARRQPELVHEVEAEPVSLRDRLQSILYGLGVARSLTFDSLFDEGAGRHYVIVTFLALLELMKLGAVEAIQEERFGPILIVLAVDDVATVTYDLLDEYEGSAPVAEEWSCAARTGRP